MAKTAQTVVEKLAQRHMVSGPVGCVATLCVRILDGRQRLLRVSVGFDEDQGESEGDQGGEALHHRIHRARARQDVQRSARSGL